MTQSVTDNRARHCFICGTDNPHGLQLEFRLVEGVCRGEYTPEAKYCGFEGVTHGGMVFSLLDDVMANWLYLQGERAYTGKCDIRYREPAAIGTRLLLESSLIKRKGRMAQMQGSASTADGTVVAEATATFIVIEE